MPVRKCPQCGTLHDRRVHGRRKRDCSVECQAKASGKSVEWVIRRDNWLYGADVEARRTRVELCVGRGGCYGQPWRRPPGGCAKCGGRWGPERRIE